MEDNVVAFPVQNLYTPELRELMYAEAKDFNAQLQLMADDKGRVVDFKESYVTKAPPSSGGAAAHIVYFLPYYDSKVRVRITHFKDFWIEIFLIISNYYDNEKSLELMSSKDKGRIFEFLIAGAGDWR